MRVSQEAYDELMKKRQGWVPGRLLFANTPREDDELAGELPGEVTPNPEHTAPPRQSGRSRTAEMRTQRQALQRATGEVARKESAIEAQFAQQIHLLKLPAPKRNYLFNPPRKQELDFAWPERRIAVEVQGMVHRIKGRFNADMEKRALALLAGWKILEVGGREIRNGVASKWLEQLLAQDVDNELRALGVPIK